MSATNTVADQFLRKLQADKVAPMTRVQLIDGPLKGISVDTSGIRPDQVIRCLKPMPIDRFTIDPTSPVQHVVESITYYTYPTRDQWGEITGWLASEYQSVAEREGATS